ncbi:DUF882 domain-containing protein [Mongoliimonas terrestris]|uniref:DUF882 domain-containing protein n=1 Tax=Mongoliimonas terrestris TaxID=1709001 RepID=UPI001FD90443|nr:DUF882 domain-containing protein [Mongoliimonas terrestris]
MKRNTGTERSTAAAGNAGSWPETHGSDRSTSPLSVRHGSDGRARRLLGALAGALAILVVTGTVAPTTAAAETRTLDLYYTHTKERLTITFKKNGKYIPSALKELNRFLRDWRRNEPTNMDPRLFDTVWEVYQQSGSRQPVHVVSAYRSLATNNMLRSRSKAVAKHSQHSLGKAMDFFLPDVGVAKLRAIGMKLQRGGVGYYPNAGNAFVHIDVGSVRAWPRMSRQQLAKLFPDGKTVHLPSDGKPLAGYQQALAELKRNGSVTRPLALAEDESGGRKRSKGLLAMLFGDQEDDTEELNAASTTGQALTAAPEPDKKGPAVVRTERVTPPIAPPAPAAPAPAPIVVADVPKPQAAPAAPPVTSLAEATLPAGLPAPEAPAPAAVADAAVPPLMPKAKPEELVALAALPPTPSLVPRGKPAELLALMAAADMPPVRPSIAAVAEAPAPAPADDVPASAALALAEVAQDPVEDRRALAALGYASAAEAPLARQPVLPPAPREQRIARAAATELTAPRRTVNGQADPLALLPPIASPKTDPLAILTAALPPVDMPVYDAGASVSADAFAHLRHPDQMSTDLLFEAPVQVVGAGFSPVRTAGVDTARFAGPAVAKIQAIRFPARRDLAMR